MPKYTLSVLVNGPGTDPNHRSHWAFAIRKDDSRYGHLLQVLVIDLPRLIYQFDLRRHVELHSQGSEGSFTLAEVSEDHVRKVVEIISQEPAPRDGVERCQDWVLRVAISLEAEELVPPGMAAWMSELVGKDAATVARVVGPRWTAGSSVTEV